jgi:hexosaminidase
MQFECIINDARIDCVLTSDRDLSSPVLCTSGMARMIVINGGTLLNQTGSYLEVALPDLTAGVPYAFSLGYDGFKPANRAWLPLGPYLRTTDGTVIELPAVRSGFQAPTDAPSQGFDGLKLIPQPTDWAPTGQFVKVTGFHGNDTVMHTVADLATRQNMGPFVQTDGHPVSFAKCDMPLDAYKLVITPDGIILTAGETGGRLYGAITLLMLLRAHNGHIPCGTITDSPRFTWRGQHLDCARHFYAPATIAKLLDLMALLKLNRFHWHFADDEAFRLQVDCFPQLWQDTETRGEGHLIPAVFSGKPEAGGSYSKDEARAVIIRAGTLNIEVMPEIEVPAHALALAKIFPDTRDPDDAGSERSVQGYTANVVNPAMPTTWDILDALATEVGALFPFGILHLGCDELPADTWMGSPRARALMAAQGLKTTQDLQGWTMAHLAQTVVQNGQRPAAWEEAAQGNNGGIGHNAILFSWTGAAPGFTAARAGYDVVMTPAQHVYMDMAHSDDTDDWGANWAATVSLTDTIAWDVIPQNEPELADRIIGVQGAFWSEFTTQDSQMWHMLAPRILGVAVKAWQQDDMTPADLTCLAADFAKIWQA